MSVMRFIFPIQLLSYKEQIRNALFLFGETYWSTIVDTFASQRWCNAILLVSECASYTVNDPQQESKVKLSEVIHRGESEMGIFDLRIGYAASKCESLNGAFMARFLRGA